MWWVGGAGVSAPLKSISEHLFGCECEQVHVKRVFNPIMPTVSYLIDEFLRLSPRRKKKLLNKSTINSKKNKIKTTTYMQNNI